MRSLVPRGRSRRAAARALLVPVALVALGACGGGGSGPGVASADGGARARGGASTSAGASGGPSAKGDMTAFARCLREHGIDVEVRDEGGGKGSIGIKGRAGGDGGAMDEAQQACRQYAPVGPGDGGKPMPKEDQEKFLAFARCMREHGVPMQDPSFEGGGVRVGIGEPSGRGATVDDRAVEAAQKACRSILPDGGVGGPAGAAVPGGAGTRAGAGA